MFDKAKAERRRVNRAIKKLNTKPVPNEPSDSYTPHRIGLHSDDRGGSSDEMCYCDKPKPVSAIGDELDWIIRVKDKDGVWVEINGEKFVRMYLEEQTKLALEVAKKDVEFAIRWNRPLEEVLEKMNQRLEASIKERSEDEDFQHI